MTEALAALYADTPDVVISNSSGAAIKALFLLRTPGQAAVPARILTSRTLNTPLSRTVEMYGTRPLASGGPDALTIASLAGSPLRLHTVDGDTSMRLSSTDGRPLWSCNGQGTVNRMDYEPIHYAGNEPPLSGRPLSLSEQPAGGASRTRERFIYRPLNAEHKARNLAGSLLCHFDNAGYSAIHSLSLTGQPLETAQHLLCAEAEPPDWCAAMMPETEPALISRGVYNAKGEPLSATNAAGVTTVTTYEITGTLESTGLQFQNHNARQDVLTLSNIVRTAEGLVLSQIAGNGITDVYAYDPRTRLLTRHATVRPANHPQGALIISDLRYTYEPAGNILALADEGADPTWHNNRLTEGKRTYGYDTLRRLVTATGRERSPTSRYRTRSADRADGCASNVWTTYTEQYSYDDGDNLTAIRHSGQSCWTRELSVSRNNNRALQKDAGQTPENGFLPGGLQKRLADGRTLDWYADSQLKNVSTLTRTDKDHDTEHYHYAHGGLRTRKIHRVIVSGETQTTVTTYAGGCETRQRRLADRLQLDIVITQSGGARLAENRTVGERHLRYSFSDHLGSTGGEADGEGRITSREEYAPYGGTVGDDEDAVEVGNLMQRTSRYSGKERDATGLIYYGWRYYLPGLGRWLSADPGGLIDGVNLFRSCRNNPVSIADTDGRHPGGSPPPVPDRPSSSRPPPVAPRPAAMSARFEYIRAFYRRKKLADGERITSENEKSTFKANTLAMAQRSADAEKIYLEKYPERDGFEGALGDYAEGGNRIFEKINNRLRGIEQTDADNRYGAEALNDLEKIFSFLPKNNGYAYRAIITDKNIYSEKISKGSIVMDKGYLSLASFPGAPFTWLENWARGLEQEQQGMDLREAVVFIFDDSVIKREAFSGFLADHLLIAPETPLQVNEIAKIPEGHVDNRGKKLPALTLVGLSAYPAAVETARNSVKNIYSGNLLSKEITRKKM